MAESFLVLWSQDRIKSLKAKGELGTPLRVVYGSPHQSAPSLLRYGVTSGDTIFVVGLKGGALHLISKVQVAQIVSADDFFRDHLRLSPAELNLRLWELEKRLALSRRSDEDRKRVSRGRQRQKSRADYRRDAADRYRGARSQAPARYCYDAGRQCEQGDRNAVHKHVV